MLTPEMQSIVKAEITNDPSGRGYAGKSAEELSGLLNQNYTVQVTTEVAMTPRFAQIMSGVAGSPAAPNVISADDIAAAMEA